MKESSTVVESSSASLWRFTPPLMPLPRIQAQLPWERYILLPVFMTVRLHEHHNITTVFKQGQNVGLRNFMLHVLVGVRMLLPWQPKNLINLT